MAALAIAVAVLELSAFGLTAVGAAVVVTEHQSGPSLGATTAARESRAVLSETLTASLHPSSERFGITHSTSSNWAGYVSVGPTGTVLEAYAEYRVGTISCSATPVGASSLNDQWVGIDGWTTGTVEQAGTYGYCSSNTATPSYVDWWEFYPYNSAQVVSSVSPGDLMNVYVLYNPYACIYNAAGTCVYGIYTLVVNDLNNYGADFSVTGNPTTCNSNGACENGADTSAECISEKASSYLGDYGTVKFLTCDATINGKWTGIGGFPSSLGVTTSVLTQYGSVTSKVDQKVSKLSSYDWKDDQFTITWVRAD